MPGTWWGSEAMLISYLRTDSERLTLRTYHKVGAVGIDLFGSTQSTVDIGAKSTSESHQYHACNETKLRAVLNRLDGRV